MPAYDDASIGMAAAAGQRAQASNPDVDPWLKQREHGRAVQVDPIKPTLKAPRIKRLNL